MEGAPRPTRSKRTETSFSPIGQSNRLKTPEVDKTAVTFKARAPFYSSLTWWKGTLCSLGKAEPREAGQGEGERSGWMDACWGWVGGMPARGEGARCL